MHPFRALFHSFGQKDDLALRPAALMAALAWAWLGGEQQHALGVAVLGKLEPEGHELFLGGGTKPAQTGA